MEVKYHAQKVVIFFRRPLFTTLAIEIRANDFKLGWRDLKGCVPAGVVHEKSDANLTLLDHTSWSWSRKFGVEDKPKTYTASKKMYLKSRFLWQTQIQMIEYGLNDMIRIKKKQVILILYSFLHSDKNF